MPIFTSDSQMVAVFQDLATQLQQLHPSSTAKLMRSRLVIRFECYDPTAELTIDAGQSPPAVHFGPNSSNPQLTIGLPADVLHCILLDDLGIRKAIGRGLVDVRGPVWKVVILGELFNATQKVYPDVLRRHGLPTTCPDGLA